MVEGLTAATEQLVAATTQLAPAVATADAGLTEEAAAAAEASTAMRTLAASQETAVGAMATTGTAAEGLAVKEEALAATSTETGVAMGEGGMAGGMAAGDAAGVGLTGVLGPLGLAVGAVTLGAVKLGDMLNNNTTPAFVKASDAADAMASSTLPDVTLKMQALTQAQKDDKVAMDQGGLSGQAAKVAYDGITSSINVLKGQAQQLTVNTQILSNNFGISKSEADSLADSIGLNLSGSLTKADVTAFAQQIQQSGIQADAAGSKLTTMGTNAVSALTAMESQLKTVSNSQDWASIGTNIDTGISGGIAGGSSIVTAAISSLAGKTLLAGQAAVGAKSPSTKARDLIGMPIAQGVAIGIAQNAGLPSAATTAMMKGVLSAGTGSLGVGIASGAATAAAGSSGGAGGGTTVLNVTTPVQVAGQTLAQIVTQYQLRGARATGNVLGQFSGGTQSQTATSINTNAVAR